MKRATGISEILVSGVFCVFDDTAPNLGPVYALVQVLVHEADAHDIVASDKVKAVFHLAALF